MFVAGDVCVNPMRFLCRFHNQGRLKPADAGALARESYEAVREYGADVGNLRVASNAVELDLLLASKDNLGTCTRALEERLGPIATVRELDVPASPTDPDQAIREGVKLFNE